MSGYICFHGGGQPPTIPDQVLRTGVSRSSRVFVRTSVFLAGRPVRSNRTAFAFYDIRSKKRPDDRVIRPLAVGVSPQKWIGVSSACGECADEALENTGVALLVCLLGRNFAVPCDLNAVG